MKQINKTSSLYRLLLSGYLLFSSFVIIIPALFNGYPLFYSDSALYIKASMLFGNIPIGEQIPYLSGLGYSFFIRIVTWKTTLWLVILAQAVILNVLIYLSLKVLLPEKKILKYHLPIIIILSICSSMGWAASQLMPDIFTSYLVLSVFLFYTWNTKSWSIYFFLSVIIIFSILSHLSNISIFILIVVFLFLLFLFHRSYRKNLKIFIRKSIIILALIFISIIILNGLNKKYYNYNGLSPTGHIFFLARLMDTGFMKEYLDEKCDEKSYEICKYKNNLPNSYESFLWDTEGVFYKTGGWDISKHEEYKEIINDVLTSPKYLGLFLKDCANHSVHQLVTFKIGDGLDSVFNKESGQYQVVIQHYNRGEFRNDFQSSKQMHGSLNFGIINLINYILLSISVLIIIWTLINKKLDRNIHFFTYAVFCGVIINAAATSSLASIFDRFQSRIIWLIPLLALIYFLMYIYPALEKKIKQLVW